MKPNLVFLFGLALITQFAWAQTPYDSEGLIKYDYTTHKTDKPIPFDRSFTLVITNLPVKDAVAVQAHEARYTNGKRTLARVELDAAGRVLAIKSKDIAQVDLYNQNKASIIRGSLSKNKLRQSLDSNEIANVKQARKEAEDKAKALSTILDKAKDGKPITAEDAKVANLARPAKGIFNPGEIKAIRNTKDAATAKAAALDSVAQGILLTETEVGNATTTARELRSIQDVSLRFTFTKEGMEIFFPPLQPNKDFDLLIFSQLSSTDRNALLSVNALIEQGKQDPLKEKKARAAFKKVADQNVDPFLQRTALGLNYDEYKDFFFSKQKPTRLPFLDSIYTALSNSIAFTIKPGLNRTQLYAIGGAGKLANLRLQRVGAGLEIAKQGLFGDMQLGLVNVTNVYQADVTELVYLHTRLQNLEANLLYADSLQQLIDEARISWSAGRPNPSLDSARTAVAAIRAAMRTNHDKLEKGVKAIENSTGRNVKIRQLVTLVGTTVASDLKTAGGNVLFVDAGLTNIGAPGLRDQLVNIPRLYWGVSIYFRPIDKNTRRNRFPTRFEPPRQTGLGEQTDGPDYRIVTQRSILQHLSLNLGFTLGALPNKEFDNLYNNMSLLVGPAYRFKRAFKVSAGLALLNRTAKDPRESAKVLTPGAYVSLSTDIDFIQGLKDVTSLLFK